jgi:hypothetical protein
MLSSIRLLRFIHEDTIINEIYLSLSDNISLETTLHGEKESLIESEV